jgi:SRSO17 transposase
MKIVIKNQVNTLLEYPDNTMEMRVRSKIHKQGVFASLGSGEKVSLVNARLYLPKEWTDDEKRCIKAGVPKKDIKYATKVQLAMDLIEELDNNGIEYGWIGADSLYGQGYEFANTL